MTSVIVPGLAAGLILYKDRVMKLSTYIFGILLFICVKTSVAQQKVLGPHAGNIYKASQGYKAELLVSNGNFYVFLLDANSKPISNKGVSCSMNVCLNNCDKIEHTLIPFSTDGFSAEKVDTRNFFSCKITFRLKGKIIVTEIYNEAEAEN